MSPSSSSLLLLLLGLIASADGRATFQRFMKQAKAAGSGDSQPVASATAAVGSVEKLMFLQNVHKEGGKIDATEILGKYIKSGAFEKLYANVEVQHRILEANPMLGALSGFREATGRRLNDAETADAFKQGVEGMMDFLKDAKTVTKNPAQLAMSTAQTLYDNGDEITKALFDDSKTDQDKAEEVQNLVAAEMMKGVDFQTLKAIADAQTFDQVLKSKELMHFVNMDQDLAGVFKSGEVLTGPARQRRKLAKEEEQRLRAAALEEGN